MTNRFRVLFSIIISIVCYCVIFYYLPNKERTLINLIGVIGFLLSILGIIIAYFQIMSVKEISKYTQEQVQQTQERLEQKIRETHEKIKENITIHSNLHMISDLSAKGAMINEIQGYLREDNIKMSAIRMKDLKVVLIDLQSQPRYSALTKKEDFKSAVGNFHVNLDNLQKQHFRNGKIDLGKINKDLEDLSSIFLSVEHKLKTLQ